MFPDSAIDKARRSGTWFEDHLMIELMLYLKGILIMKHLILFTGLFVVASASVASAKSAWPEGVRTKVDNGGGFCKKTNYKESGKDAKEGFCKKAVVDCKSHTMTFGEGSGAKKYGIQCGPPTRNSGAVPGKLGKCDRWGTVGDWCQVEGIDGMGKSGGMKIFHCMPGGPQPKGDRGLGCITVTREVLVQINRCGGNTDLTIKNAAGGITAKQKAKEKTNKPLYDAPARSNGISI